MTKERLIELLDQGAITLIGLHESEDILNLIASLSDTEVLARFSTNIWQEVPSVGKEKASDASSSEGKQEPSGNTEEEADEPLSIKVNPSKAPRKKKGEDSEASEIVVDEV